MNFLSSKASLARAKLHATAVSIAMLTACGGGSDNRGAVPVLLPGPQLRNPQALRPLRL
ncbi:hypothetical protein [Variovorax paradoxus]|uniref:hypothetical protein n=1 Tax=Variovorax paradoxus TaxID=34073 RepID=UPI001E4E1D9D|nr:hypothetical protein [Variovorax paradoxus]